MPGPSSSQLVSLRNRGVETKLHLAVYQPPVVFAAQINDAAVAKGAVQLTFDNVTQGSWVNATKDLTLYAGTTSLGRDLGRVRIKGATSAYLILGRNDHINWADDVYITVVNFIEPWGIFQRITLDPTNINANPQYFEDDTDSYTNENTFMPPVICMGSNNVVFAGDSIDWHSSGTFSPVGATFNAYIWAFSGGVPATSSAAHPGMINYPNAGNYVASLAVNDTNGVIYQTFRYVVVLPNPDAGIQSWGMTSLQGDRSQGGWVAQMWVREKMDLVEGSLVMVVAEDWYNGVKLAIPNTIVFVGYVQDKTLHWDWKSGRLEFAAQGICNIVNQRETYGVALDSIDPGGDQVGDGRDWTRMANITTDKGLIHYLMFHTTLLRIADFHQTGDTKLKMFCDIAHGPIYGAAQSYLQQNLIASLVANRVGALYAEIDVNVVPSGTRSLPTIIDMDSRDWRGQPEIQRVLVPTVSYVEVGGVAYGGGQSGTITPLLSGAPGETPAYQGSPQIIEGLVLLDQDTLNVLSGNYFADQSSQFAQVTFPMVGNYRFFDIAPQERATCTLDGTETPEGLVWNKQALIPQTVTHNYIQKGHLLMTDVTFKAETAGFPGDTIVVPITPPDGTCASCPPPCTGPDCGGGGGNVVPDLVYVFANGVMGRSRNFLSAPSVVSWENVTGSTAGTGIGAAFILDPWGPKQGAFRAYANIVEHTGDLDDSPPTWAAALTTATLTGIFGGSGYSFKYLAGSITESGLVYAAWNYSAGVGISCSHDSGATWTHTHITALGGNVFRIIADTSIAGKVWWIGDLPGHGTFGYSLDYGATWTVLSTSFNYIVDFDIGYPDAATIIYRLDDKLYYSHNNGGSFTPYTIASPSGFNSGLIKLNIATLNESDILWVENSTSYHSTDGGVTYTIGVGMSGSSCTGGGGGSVYAVGRWPYDINKVFWLWCPAGVSPNPAQIAYSDDLMVTVQNKMGNWNAVMGTFANPVMIIPVWVP